MRPTWNAWRKYMRKVVVNNSELCQTTASTRYALNLPQSI